MSEKKPAPPADRKPGRKFFFWFYAVQMVPVVAIPSLWPRYNRVWVLIILANTSVFLFNLARQTGRAGGHDAKTNRLLLFVAAGMFAVMFLCWLGGMALQTSLSAQLAD
ncbi:MAG: hypothetical protein GY851_17360 [bacterium]|nr:hypothetical protein [bacterium]